MAQRSNRRLMEITTPLGQDLLFHRMSAREELGRLSEFEIDLLSPRSDIKFSEILAKNVTVRLQLANMENRYFNGYVTRFSQSGMRGRYHLYHASVRPWTWFMTRTANCRIFQKLKAPDIIKKVFDEHEMADVELELTASYREWEYCVQYRETDFDFASRLMEQEGMYYYFKHSEGRHTLVLTDSYSGHSPFPGHEQIPFVIRDRIHEHEGITDWTIAHEVHPGSYVINDYNFKAPKVDRLSTSSHVRQHDLAGYEWFDYPGKYETAGEGEHYVRTRLEEVQSQVELAEATTNCRGLCTGSLFTLKRAPRGDQEREYLVVGAMHDLEFSEYESLENGGSDYSCRFKAIHSRQPFRSQRITTKPIVQGPQTAVVVGPSGDEIYTDEHGRVKVQFHWDRYGEHDENSSCWIRVSHPWAGKAWGAVSIPRIGQEVVVDFLEGDPDRPIITGRVYNADLMPPYGLPAGKVVSGLKTNSTPGGGGYNEMSMDDTAGKEKITIHGQYDMNTTVEHDETITIHGKRTEIVDKDEKITIHQNRTESVDHNETIDIGDNRSITVAKSETAKVALQRTHLVGINETIGIGAAQEIGIGAFQAVGIGAYQMVKIGAYQSVSVGAAQTIKVGANQSITVGANQSEAVTGNASKTVKGNDSLAVDGNRSAHVKGDDSAKIDKNLVIDAGDSVTIKTGGASITMKKDGTITIKGKNITIDDSAKTNLKASGNIVMKGSKILQN